LIKYQEHYKTPWNYGVGGLGELQEHKCKMNFRIFIFTIIFFVIGIFSFVLFALDNFKR